uniref:Uncharacterized protein n=1 Tax=Sphaerodactylus townsendi TaxID=933632 RepID=A0ACB8EAX0_9SAUR
MVSFQLSPVLLQLLSPGLLCVTESRGGVKWLLLLLLRSAFSCSQGSPSHGRARAGGLSTPRTRGCRDGFRRQEDKGKRTKIEEIFKKALSLGSSSPDLLLMIEARGGRVLSSPPGISHFSPASWRSCIEAAIEAADQGLEVLQPQGRVAEFPLRKWAKDRRFTGGCPMRFNPEDVTGLSKRPGSEFSRGTIISISPGIVPRTSHATLGSLFSTMQPLSILPLSSSDQRTGDAKPNFFQDCLMEVFDSLEQHIQNPVVLQSILQLMERGTMVLTTNYDNLLEIFGQQQGKPMESLDLKDKDKVLQKGRISHIK